MTTTSVDESISVTVAEPPVDATGGVLPITLARLTGEFLDFVNILADTDPSDAAAIAELEALLNRSVAAIQDKTVAIAAVIREFEARAEGAHTEAERIAIHGRAANSRAAWLRDYLLRNLELLGVQRIETATTVVVVRKSPPAVQVVDEGRSQRIQAGRDVRRQGALATSLARQPGDRWRTSGAWPHL